MTSWKCIFCGAIVSTQQVHVCPMSLPHETTGVPCPHGISFFRPCSLCGRSA